MWNIIIIPPSNGHTAINNAVGKVHLGKMERLIIPCREAAGDRHAPENFDSGFACLLIGRVPFHRTFLPYRHVKKNEKMGEKRQRCFFFFLFSSVS